MATKITNVQIFQPTQTSGCVLWLDGGDASTMYTDIGGTTPVSSSGQSIAYWRDKSTSANHATNATNQPTVLLGAQNKLPLVNFNGSQYLNLTVAKLPTGSTPFTFFFLVRTASSAVQVYFTYGTATNGQCVQLYYNNYILYNDLYGAAGPSDNTTYNGTFALMATTASATVYTAWDYSVGFAVANNVPITLNTGTSFAYLGVGQVSNSLTFYLNGQIAEVISYNRVVSTFERQQIEGYLAWKWGVQANLPASHPYINYPPYASPPFPTPVSIPRSMTNVQIFQPIQIPGCVIWLDAADRGTVGFSGSAVSTWTSKGSASLTATSVGAGSILYSNYNGYPSLYFNGSSTKLTTGTVPSYGTTGTTWITVSANLTPITATTPVDSSVVIATLGGTSPEKSIRYQYLNQFTIYAINNGFLRGVIDENTNGIRGFLDQAATFVSYVNGNLVKNDTNPATYQAGVNQAFQLGNWNTGYLLGHIQEVLIYNSVLSLANYQRIEGYLAWKWGLQGLLPASHPFKNYPMYALPPFPTPLRIPRVITRS